MLVAWQFDKEDLLAGLLLFRLIITWSRLRLARHPGIRELMLATRGPPPPRKCPDRAPVRVSHAV